MFAEGRELSWLDCHFSESLSKAASNYGAFF